MFSVACGKQDDKPVENLPDISLTEVISSADISAADSAKYLCNDIVTNEYDSDGHINYLYKTYKDNIYIISSVYGEGTNDLVITNTSIDSASYDLKYCDVPDSSMYVSDNVVDLVERAEEYINNRRNDSDFYNYDHFDSYDVVKDFTNLFFSENGRIYGIVNFSFSFSSANLSETATSKAHVLCCWNIDGSLMWNTKLCISENVISYIDKAFFFNDKYVCVYFNDNALYLCEVNSSGNANYGGMVADDYFLRNIIDCISVTDGKNIVFQLDNNGNTVASYMNNDLTIAGSVLLPDYIMINGYQDVCKKDENTLVFSDTQGVFEYNLADNSFVCLMDYVNSDFNGYYIDNISFIDNTSFVGKYYSFDYFAEKVGLFSINNAKNNKAIVLLGSHNLPIESREQIKKYNESDSPYRIVVDNYALFDTVDNTDAGYEKLSQDIINSNGPDLLMINPGCLNVHSLVEQNKLMSWDYLANLDDTITYSDYLTDVISAYSVNDLNYIFVYDFIYRTFIGNIDIVGSKNSWSVKDFKKALNSAPSKDAVLYRYITREKFTDHLIKYNAGEYIDYEGKKSSFNNKDFIELIEYGAGLPDEMNRDEEIYLYYQDSCRNGNILLVEESVVEVDDFWNDAFRYFDGKASLIGFPSSDETAAYVEYVDLPIMVMADGNVAGAWNFARTFYETEYQRGLTMAIPVKKDVFESWANKPLKYSSLEQEKYYYNGSEHTIPNIEAQNIDGIKNLIIKTNTAAFYDEYIINIICEEIETYYNNAQTSKQAAANIDKRIGEYLN